MTELICESQKYLYMSHEYGGMIYFVMCSYVWQPVLRTKLPPQIPLFTFENICLCVCFNF